LTGDHLAVMGGQLFAAIFAADLVFNAELISR
jgi:hypothetical protein